MNIIYNFLKKLWEWLKSIFGCGKKKPIVRISILLLLLFVLSPILAQRPNLQYVYASFQQADIEQVEYYTVKWNTDSLNIFLSDTANVKVLLVNQWVPYQAGMNVDSVRLQVNRNINFNTEYVFRVVAKNSSGKNSSDPVPAYFIVSDVSLDNSVDGVDLIRLARKWGYGGMGYRDWEDINGDGFVDGLDLIKMSNEWGRTWVP